jgi:glycosyltransferase involved in cell wall biosynthesis
VKIAHVVHGFPPECRGGTEHVVEVLARAMHGAGHDCVVVAGSLQVGAPNRVDESRHDGLRVVRIHRDDLWFESWWKTYAPGPSAAFARLLDVERPDVVHVHHWLRLSSDLVRRARAAGAVTAVTLHDHFAVLARPVRAIGETVATPPPVQPFVGAAERDEAFAFHRRDFAAEIRAADLRYVPSGAHAQSVWSLLPMADGGAPPLPSIATPPVATTLPRIAARAGVRARRLVFFGALYEAKGLDVVLAAMRRLDPVADADVALSVFGAAHDPGYEARLRAAADGLAVRFHGAYDLDSLRATDADFVVLPAITHESYGLTFDEACALGLPVLASDLPAWRERAPSAGVAFFEPGNVDALARLLGDATFLARMPAPEPIRCPTPDQAAAALLADYADARARVGARATTPTDDAVRDERDALLWRRAERRLWSLLQRPDAVAPPDEFLSDA